MGLQDIKGYMIGVLLGIVVLTSGILMFTNLNVADPTLDSTNKLDDFSATFNKSAEISTSVNNMDVADTEQTTFGWIDSLARSAYNGLKAIKGSMGFVQVAAEDSTNAFDVQEIRPIVVLITLVIVIIISIAIYEAVMRV